MHLSRSARVLSAAAFTLALLPGLAAHADTTTDIVIPYPATGLYGSYWSNAANGGDPATATKSGNTGTGLTFANWNGQFNAILPSQTTSFNMGNVALGSSAVVNTLMDTIYGDGELDAIVTFTNSQNQTATYNMYGGDTLRDYHQNVYQNLLAGGTPGLLTAQNWWNDGSSNRLDAQTFYLPASWNGTMLTSMTIYNPTTPPENPHPEDALSALQVVTNGPSQPTGPMAVTPEPSSFALLLTGASGMFGLIKRRLHA